MEQADVVDLRRYIIGEMEIQDGSPFCLALKDPHKTNLNYLGCSGTITGKLDLKVLDCQILKEQPDLKVWIVVHKKKEKVLKEVKPSCEGSFKNLKSIILPPPHLLLLPLHPW